MQLRALTRCHLTPTRTTALKKTGTSADTHVGKLGPLLFAVGVLNKTATPLKSQASGARTTQRLPGGHTRERTKHTRCGRGRGGRGRPQAHAHHERQRCHAQHGNGASTAACCPGELSGESALRVLITGRPFPLSLILCPGEMTDGPWTHRVQPFMTRVSHVIALHTLARAVRPVDSISAQPGEEHVYLSVRSSAAHHSEKRKQLNRRVDELW